MTAKIVDLDKWREEHPPLVQLANISANLMRAHFKLQRNAWRAWFSLFFRRQ
jgi:hypothetical protein